MKKLSILFLLIVFSNTAYATSEHEAIRDFVKEIFESNSKYVESSSSFYTYNVLAQQTPRATILMCSDSRLDSKSIDNTPVGDIFIVIDTYYKCAACAYGWVGLFYTAYATCAVRLCGSQCLNSHE